MTLVKDNLVVDKPHDMFKVKSNNYSWISEYCSKVLSDYPVVLGIHLAVGPFHQPHPASFLQFSSECAIFFLIFFFYKSLVLLFFFCNIFSCI